jgi:RHS repeat-associated protein
VTLAYDGDGNRVAKSAAGVTTQYLVDDLNPTGYSQVVEEIVAGSVQRSYSYGLQRIDENQLVSGVWAPSFYGYDAFGSVRFLTDPTGAVTDTYDYDGWGNKFHTTGSTPNNYLYRGEQYDPDLTLYYLRARYFNPLTGRFLSRDPEAGKTTDPKTLRKYLYAGGDPINAWDPTGRQDEVEFSWINAEELPTIRELNIVGKTVVQGLCYASFLLEGALVVNNWVNGTEVPVPAPLAALCVSVHIGHLPK